MKINSKITAGLIAAGLISAASVANASSTYLDSGSGITYQVVYVTGSSAFRATFETLCATNSGGLFVGGPTKTQGSGVPNATSAAFWGVLNDGSGTHYIIDVDFTGSEAGLAALHEANITYQPDYTLSGAPSSPSTVRLPNTPDPSGFVDPATGNANVTAWADIAFSDTSKAVSFSKNIGLTEYGNVAIIPFYVMKGYYNNPSQAWLDMNNIATVQMPYFFAAGKELANYFTGKQAETQPVYYIGRNEGSGTRANYTLQAGFLPPRAFTQYVPSSSTYVNDASGNPVLTLNGSSWGSTIHSLGLGYEGWESGSKVAGTLNWDSSTLENGAGAIVVGVVGISDASGAPNATAINVDGYAENDGNIIDGAYSVYGYEHMNGRVTPTSQGVAVANTVLAQLPNYWPASYSDSGHSAVIDPSQMNAGKSQTSVGYPTQ